MSPSFVQYMDATSNMPYSFGVVKVELGSYDDYSEYVNGGNLKRKKVNLISA